MHKNIRTIFVSLIVIVLLAGFSGSVSAATITWTGGGADNLASNSANWSNNSAPQYGDNVVFDSTSKDCTWDLTVTLASLSIKSGYSGKVTKISNISLTIAKGKTWTGGGTDNLASNPANWSGNIAPQNGDNVVFNGTNNCIWDINVAPASITLNSGFTGMVTLNSDLTITGGLTIDGGILNLNNKALNANSYISIGIGGNLYATSSTITVKGNWLNYGSFFPGTSTVIFNGTNQAIYGNTTFYNLIKTVTSAQTLYFEAGKTQTILNTLTFQGASGNLLAVRSTQNGSYWYINPQGTRNISYVDIKDMNNLNIVSIVTTNSVNSGNNTNVSFGGSECACLKDSPLSRRVQSYFPSNKRGLRGV